MQPTMTPAQVEQASNALIAAVRNDATSAGNNINTAAGQLAPGLATGTNAPGGLNYQRYIAPTTATLVNPIVTQTKQAVLKQTLKDAQNTAQVSLADAQLGYRLRQRQWQRQQAIEAEQERQRAQAAQAAQIAAMSASNGIPFGYDIIAEDNPAKKSSPSNNSSTPANKPKIVQKKVATVPLAAQPLSMGQLNKQLAKRPFGSLF